MAQPCGLPGGYLAGAGRSRVHVLDSPTTIGRSTPADFMVEARCSAGTHGWGSGIWLPRTPVGRVSPNSRIFLPTSLNHANPLLRFCLLPDRPAWAPSASGPRPATPAGTFLTHGPKPFWLGRAISSALAWFWVGRLRRMSLCPSGFLEAASLKARLEAASVEYGHRAGPYFRLIPAARPTPHRPAGRSRCSLAGFSPLG